MADILDPNYRAQTEAAREGLVTQPANAAAIGLPERALAFTHNLVEGVPVIGPAALDLSNRLMGGDIEGRAAYAGQLDQALPGTALAGNIVGAVAGSIPFLMAAPAFFGLGSGTVAARAVQGAVGNAALGGADAAVRSAYSPGGFNAGTTAIGAGVGAAGGLVAPYVASAFAGAANAAVNWVRGTTAAIRETGLEPGLASTVGRALQADNLGPTPVTQRLLDLGPEGMLMDTGPAMRELGAGLAAGTDDAARAVQEPLWTRRAAAPARVNNALTLAVGPRRDIDALYTQLVDGGIANAQPLYLQAYATLLPPLAQMPEVSAALQTVVGRQAWARAARLAEAEGMPIFADAPTVRAIDLWQRELRDMARRADASARTTGTNEARVIAGGPSVTGQPSLRSRILAEIDAIVPDFAQARATFAGAAEVRDAINAGMNAFGSRTLLPDMQTAFAEMSQTAQEAYALAAFASVWDNLETAASNQLSAQQFFSRPNNIEKLRFLIGDTATQDFVLAFGREFAMDTTATRAFQAIQEEGIEAARAALAGPATTNLTGTTAVGLGTQAVAAGARAVAQPANLATVAARRTALAELATMGPGPERDLLVRSLLAATPFLGNEMNSLRMVISSLGTGAAQMGERAAAQ